MPIEPARALIVEDSPAWQEILAEILADLGLAVDIAGSLADANAALRRIPHRLAVVDLSLEDRPGQNEEGLAVLDAIRRCDPGCTPILLTGYATVDVAVNALTERGAYTCLRKEAFRRAEFRDLVRRVLALAPAAAQEPQAEEKQSFDRAAFRRTVEDAIALTPREHEVLSLLVQGLANKEIAREMVISTNTVKRYLKSIFEKLGVDSRAAAVAAALRAGPAARRGPGR